MQIFAEASVDVSSASPGVVKFAPNEHTPPNVFSAPTIFATDSSGKPFCVVTTTPFPDRKSFKNVTIFSLSRCFVIRKITSYLPFCRVRAGISSGVKIAGRTVNEV